LPQDGPQRPASKFFVERHNRNSTIVMTQLDVTATLASLNESHLGQSAHCFRP